MRHSKEQGFSLVELAIVLVIIGLITGGILTGQDLIRSSEINSLAADANKFKTATNTFRTKYNGLPGDLVNAISYWTAETCPGAVGGNATGTCNGDNDGQIDMPDWVTPTANEVYRAWEQLALAGLIPGSYTGLPATATTATSAGLDTNNVPVHRANGFWQTRYIIPATSLFNVSGHFFAAYGSSPTTPSITSAEMAGLDGKYDDGRPGSGTIMTEYNITYWPNCASTNVASTSVYQVATTGNACVPIFWNK